MHELRIPDTAGITGKTLGRTVKLPAAVTHIIWEQLPNKEHYKIIMDDILIFSTREQHWEDLANLFEVLIRFGLKISLHKCQLFRDKLVYMGLEFLIKNGTAHYTAM